MITPAPGFSYTEPFYVHKNTIIKDIRTTINGSDDWSDFIHSIAKFNWSSITSSEDEIKDAIGAVAAKNLKRIH